ncbi:MAG: Rrf2 family transcriptional regulator [bacterium]
MTSLSQTTGYAIMTMSCLDGPGGRPVRVSEVARCTGIPRSYLSKIVQNAAAKGLIKTKRGYKGGMLLMRPPEEITLWDIAEVLESPKWMGKCFLGFSSCLQICPVHDFWEEEKRRIEAELRSKTLAEITRFRGCSPREMELAEGPMESPLGEER